MAIAAFGDTAEGMRPYEGHEYRAADVAQQLVDWLTETVIWRMTK